MKKQVLIVFCMGIAVCWLGIAIAGNIDYSEDPAITKKSIVWPNPRFIDNGNGTVTDKLTELIWLKNANAIGSLHTAFDNKGATGDGKVFWRSAMNFMAAVNAGTYDCGVTTFYDDWRLPNRLELESLLDSRHFNPAVPNTSGMGQHIDGNPFTNLMTDDYYWSSTSYSGNTSYARSVNMGNAYVDAGDKSIVNHYVWLVRGGN